MNTILHASKIYFTDGTFQPGIVVLAEDGTITYAGSAASATKPQGNHLDFGDHYIVPGFIDIHVHGGHGISFGFGDLKKDLLAYSQWIAESGVCGFVMSITGPDADTILAIIQEYTEILENTSDWPGALPLGLHLEGPYLNPHRHGAFNPQWIHPPHLEELHAYLQAGRGWIKHISMAPELENALQAAEVIAQAGAVVSLGHSDTDFETASAALAGPFTHITHTFNAQSPLHHRAPGVVGAALASEQATAELIGDPHHVHPGAMRILYRCLGSERVVLISDAMPGAGLPDGKYELVGQKVTVRDGKATLPDGTLGGSLVTMADSLRVMTRQAGVPLEHAVPMTSANPARVIREEDRMGSLTAGKLANLVILDAQLEVAATFVKGKKIYERGP